MADDPLPGRAGEHKTAPGSLGLTLVAIFLCFSLATAGATMLVEGLGRQDFGWVRYFGAVTFADRPIAFAAVTVMYLAATLVPAWGVLVLIERFRRSWSGKA